jgi:site-specific DNA-methyltransferase (adenine-specific)
MKPTDILGNIKLYNADCMEVMKTFKGKQFDLAIIDPPYGIGANKMTLGNGRRKIFRGSDDWDAESPTPEYFNELFRVSKNQIIWGANHFISKMPIDSKCWIFWDKGTGNNDFADGELAWTSFGSTVRKFFKSWVGANAKEKTDIDRIHPTQKPVQLYKWLLQNYAEEGDTILDTHFGSLSIGIACHDLKFDLTAIELDKDYYEHAKQRLINHQRQLTLF